jgi:hypothetical protein
MKYENRIYALTVAMVIAMAHARTRESSAPSTMRRVSKPAAL